MDKDKFPGNYQEPDNDFDSILRRSNGDGFNIFNLLGREDENTKPEEDDEEDNLDPKTNKKVSKTQKKFTDLLKDIFPSSIDDKPAPEETKADIPSTVNDPGTHEAINTKIVDSEFSAINNIDAYAEEAKSHTLPDVEIQSPPELEPNILAQSDEILPVETNPDIDKTEIKPDDTEAISIDGPSSPPTTPPPIIPTQPGNETAVTSFQTKEMIVDANPTNKPHENIEPAPNQHSIREEYQSQQRSQTHEYQTKSTDESHTGMHESPHIDPEPIKNILDRSIPAKKREVSAERVQTKPNLDSRPNYSAQQMNYEIPPDEQLMSELKRASSENYLPPELVANKPSSTPEMIKGNTENRLGRTTSAKPMTRTRNNVSRYGATTGPANNKTPKTAGVSSSSSKPQPMVSTVSYKQSITLGTVTALVLLAVLLVIYLV